MTHFFFLKKRNHERFLDYSKQFIKSASNDKKLESLLKDIEYDLNVNIRTNDEISLKHLERLLISLLGFDNLLVRENAVRLLNILYDGHDWQVSFFFFTFFF